MPETWIKTENSIENKDFIYTWIKRNRQTFISIIAIIIAIIIIISVVLINLSKNRETAEKYMFLAQQYLAAGKIDESISQLDIVEKNFARYPQSDFAMLKKGDIYFLQQNYAKAIEQYNNAYNKISNKELLPFALYSMAKSYQALRDYNNAILKFNDFINKYPDHYLLPEIYLSLAITYEAKNEKELAKQTYQKIMVLYPQTQWEDLAKQAIKKYESKK